MAHTSHSHGHSHGSDGPGSVGADLKDKAAEVAQNVRDMGGRVGEAAREQFDNLREHATDYVKGGKKKVQEWEDDVEDYIKTQPVKAILIAAGVGVILGLMWRRR